MTSIGSSSFNNLMQKKKTPQQSQFSFKERSLFNSALRGVSKLGNFTSRTVRGQIINKPKETINNLLKSSKNTIVEEQIFYFDYMIIENIFVKLNNNFYKSQNETNKIIPRIDLKKINSLLNLKFIIPRDVFMGQNIIGVQYNILKNSSEIQEVNKIIMKIDEILILLEDSINKPEQYKNTIFIKKLELFKSNLTYLKEQKYVDENTKIKLCNFLNQFIKNIFDNFQNNINFSRYLINLYCQTFGIYIKDYNYYELYLKLLDTNKIIYEEKEIDMGKLEEIESNDSHTQTRALNRLKLQKYKTIQKLVRITDRDTDERPISVIVQKKNWDSLIDQLNKYFFYPKNDFTKDNIKKLGYDLIKLLISNVYFGTSLLINIETLLTYDNKKIPNTSGKNNKIKEQVTFIYKLIISKQYLPIKKQVIENGNEINKLYSEIQNNLLQLSQNFNQENYDLKTNLDLNKNLILTVLNNLIKIKGMKNTIELKNQNKLNYERFILRLCDLFKLINGKIDNFYQPSVLENLESLFIEDIKEKSSHFTCDNKPLSDLIVEIKQKTTQKITGMTGELKQQLMKMVLYCNNCFVFYKATFSYPVSLDLDNTNKKIINDNYKFIRFFNFIYLPNNQLIIQDERNFHKLLTMINDYVKGLVKVIKDQYAEINLKLNQKKDRFFRVTSWTYDKDFRPNIEFLLKNIKYLENLVPINILIINDVQLINNSIAKNLSIKEIYNNLVKSINKLKTQIKSNTNFSSQPVFTNIIEIP